MCGIFGFVSKGQKSLDLRRLQTIAQATERRGHHAFGFAWIDSVGRLRMFKQTGRVSDYLPILGMASDARMLIGHCRWATHGDHSNLNNHPHSVDGGWLVHNGVIRDYREIIDEYDLAPVTQCDSEVIALLIEELSGTFPQRAAQAACIAGASGPLALAAVWKPEQMVLARAGNPLCMGQNDAGYYFASDTPGLPSGAVPLADDRIYVFKRQGRGVSYRSFDLEAKAHGVTA
jgi:glucosamine--fructose-6-phosphate aminotransferase (isomerizing)